ncbi:MAG: hypothetical protein KVP17_000916 [Porospora cf. gigantea B]|uniref:uncharacterized protein n=1 Tax=Porospora cf. gigantea B TaxID=2853592 RepID=UPI0035719728|nr:MAG: hypothetical protein KVP17_000916 [Porospora cf. gigantea B]
MKIATQARSWAGPPVEVILVSSYLNANRQTKPTASAAAQSSVQTSRTNDIPDTTNNVSVKDRVALFSSMAHTPEWQKKPVSASSPRRGVMGDVKRHTDVQSNPTPTLGGHTDEKPVPLLKPKTINPPSKKPSRSGPTWIPAPIMGGHTDEKPVPPAKPKTSINDLSADMINPPPNETSRSGPTWITATSRHLPVQVVRPHVKIPFAAETKELDLPQEHTDFGQTWKLNRPHVYDEVSECVDGGFSVSNTTLQLSGEGDQTSIDGMFNVESASDDDMFSAGSTNSDGSSSGVKSILASIPTNLNSLKRAVSRKASKLFRRNRGTDCAWTQSTPVSDEMLPVPQPGEGIRNLCAALSVETIQSKFNDAETNLDFESHALTGVEPLAGDSGWLLMDVLLLDVLYQLNNDVLINFKPCGRANTFVRSFHTPTEGPSIPLFRVNPLVFDSDDLSHFATLIHHPSLEQIKESLLNFLRILTNPNNQTADTLCRKVKKKLSIDEVATYIRTSIGADGLYSDVIAVVFDWCQDPGKDVASLTDELTNAARKQVDFERHPRYTQMV